jgi:hypothetical protein
LHGDTATLGRILADDFVAIGPRGFVLFREQWLSRHDCGKFPTKLFDWDEVGIRVHGGAAVMVGRETARAVYEEGEVRHEVQDQFRTTLIFVAEQARWLLLGVHLSPIAAPPAGRPAQDPTPEKAHD